MENYLIFIFWLDDQKKYLDFYVNMVQFWGIRSFCFKADSEYFLDYAIEAKEIKTNYKGKQANQKITTISVKSNEVQIFISLSDSLITEKNKIITV